MRSVLMRCRQFLREEEAPTATEYAVMLALIVVVAIGAIALLGGRVSETMSDTAESIGGGQ